jgi:WD40 repeat protein
MSRNGQYWAAANWGGKVRVWAEAGRTLHRVWQAHSANVFALAFSPDGRTLASGSYDGSVKLWDVESGTLLWMGWHTGSIVGVASAVAGSPSGELLISGGSDGVLRWWEVDSGHCVRVRKAHQGTVQALKVSPDGTRLASCGDDGVINVWDLQSGDLLQMLRRDRPYERLDITGIRGLTQTQKASLRALGAIEDMSVGG